MTPEQFGSGANIIDFYYDPNLDGMLATKVDLDSIAGKRVWLAFAAEYKDYEIFVSPTNINIGKNHIEFYGTFGKLKVYRYVRK